MSHGDMGHQKKQRFRETEGFEIAREAEGISRSPRPYGSRSTLSVYNYVMKKRVYIVGENHFFFHVVGDSLFVRTDPERNAPFGRKSSPYLHLRKARNIYYTVESMNVNENEAVVL